METDFAPYNEYREALEMNKQRISFYAKDGTVYIYDTIKKQWFDLRPIKSVPVEIKNQIIDLKETVDALKDA